jgi:hypothetical protein
MQNPPLQEMTFAAAGFPSRGGSVRAHVLPFQKKPMDSCTGSCETVHVPTLTQLADPPQDTLAIPHGPGALPVQTSVAVASCHDVPFHTLASVPWIRMHSVWLAQLRLGRPPLGLGMVRQVVPFHRSAPVGPPEAMQNLGEEQDTRVSAVPRGFVSFRQLLPVQIIASECLT